MWFKLSLLIAIFNIGSLVLFSQSSTNTIQIKDALTGEPVSFVQVLVKQITNGKVWQGTSNNLGNVVFPLDLPAEVSVYMLGYQFKKDTIVQNGTSVIYLSPRMFSIDDVVVTGQASPIKADQSIYKVKLKSVSRNDLIAATDMHQLLQKDASVRLTNDMLLGSKISMQGLPGQYVKVLVDGIPVAGRMDGNIDLSQIDLSNISHVEIVEGPLSVIYGSGALAGTINIITREQTSAKTKVTAGIYGESVGLVRANASIGKKQGNHHWGFNSSGYYFGGWSDTDTLFRAHIWKPKQRATADAYYLFAKNKMRLKYATSMVTEKLIAKGEPIGLYRDKAFDTTFTTTRFDNKLEVANIIDGKYRTEALVAYNYYRRLSNEVFNDFRAATQNVTATDTTLINQFASRLIFTGDKKTAVGYSLGYDIIWEQTQGGRIVNNQQSVGNYAAFANLVIKPFDVLTLQPGVRFTHNTRYDAPATWSGNILYSPTIWVQMRLSAAKSFRSPTLKELFLYFKDSNHDVTGNPLLKAEDAKNYNANITFSFAKNKIGYEIAAKAFYNHLNNMIELLPIGAVDGPYTYTNINIAKTIGLGIDASMVHHPKYEFTLGWVTTGRWDNLLQGEPRFNKFHFSNDVTSSFTYKLTQQKMGVGVYYKYNDRQLSYVLISDAAGETIEQNKLSSFHWLDLSISKQLFNQKLNITTGSKNVLNVTKVQQKGRAQAIGIHKGNFGSSVPLGFGRTYFIQLNYLFNNY